MTGPPVALLAVAIACSPDRSEPLSPTGSPVPSGVPEGPPLRELASARVVFTGDVMMHGMVQRSAADADRVEGGLSLNHAGYDELYRRTKALVSSADLAFANLETPVSPRTYIPLREMVFNVRPDLLGSLASTGFDVISYANNHVYDQGRPGLVETLEQLEASPLAWIGAGHTCAEARKARQFTVGGIRLALIGATELFNDYLNAGDDEPCAAMLDRDEAWVLAEAEAARDAGADIVMLSLHWGVEYDIAPQQRQIYRAHRLIDGGIDAIIGHHPHVLQPIEVYPAADGRLGVIAYSLGNYVSNQSAWYVPGMMAADQGNPRDGLLLSMRLVKRRYGHGRKKVERTELADVVATPLWTENNTRARGSEPVLIRVVPTADRMAALDQAIAALDQASASPGDDAELVKLSRERAEMDVRWRTVGDIVGAQFLPMMPGLMPSDR